MPSPQHTQISRDATDLVVHFLTGEHSLPLQNEPMFRLQLQNFIIAYLPLHIPDRGDTCCQKK